MRIPNPDLNHREDLIANTPVETELNRLAQVISRMGGNLRGEFITTSHGIVGIGEGRETHSLARMNRFVDETRRKL
jgi:hypothetical protein